jgi:hypothetical protein
VVDVDRRFRDQSDATDDRRPITTAFHLVLERIRSGLTGRKPLRRQRWSLAKDRARVLASVDEKRGRSDPWDAMAQTGEHGIISDEDPLPGAIQQRQVPWMLVDHPTGKALEQPAMNPAPVRESDQVHRPVCALDLLQLIVNAIVEGLGSLLVLASLSWRLAI